MDPSGRVVKIEDVLGSTRDAVTGTVTLQLGQHDVEVPTSQEAELWTPFGFLCIPAGPTPRVAAAQVLCVIDSARDMCFAGRDARGQALYGALMPGETCVYAPTGMARTLYKADGSITHLTTSDNTSGGTTITSIQSPTGFSWVTPWGTMTLDAKGFTVITSGGASFQVTPSGTVAVIGSQFVAQVSQAAIGAGASALTPCAVAIGGTTVSKSVFIGP